MCANKCQSIGRGTPPAIVSIRPSPTGAAVN